ncbi:hypothetical protein ELQ92_01745 [Labedella populi]|uniref:Uncharacterized protein n=1 Tax=Labedella populi TaxID=2498850 RepID=A0A3S4ECB5_9MICO|nr:hypothetical protein [Labedella populi]RWZ68007.1 hypothetical protein ELQ92_01745 [Labedella populi]
MPAASDVPCDARATASQIVQTRPVRRRAVVTAVAVAAVLFIVVCVLVGGSVAAPTHARTYSEAAPKLPAADSPIGVIAILMAVALSLLATVIVLRMLATSKAWDGDLATDCAGDESSETLPSSNSAGAIRRDRGGQRPSGVMSA